MYCALLYTKESKELKNTIRQTVNQLNTITLIFINQGGFLNISIRIYGKQSALFGGCILFYLYGMFDLNVLYFVYGT